MGHTYVESGNPDSLLTRKLIGRWRTPASSRFGSHGLDAVLRLLKDDAGQRVLSVSPRGVPESTSSITRELLARGWRRHLLEPYETTVTRDYSFDPTDVLARRRRHSISRTRCRGHRSARTETAVVPALIQP
jgi:outer membrane lipopolysaccharide assembly protein LptE/RlpB